jgi:predicted transcriptional regulator
MPASQSRVVAPRRSKVEIYFEILRTCSVLHLPTKIMYEANLSWRPMRAYMEQLEGFGLVVERDADMRDERVKTVYYLTDSGLVLLRRASRMGTFAFSEYEAYL